MSNLDLARHLRSTVILRHYDAAGHLLKEEKTTNSFTYAMANVMMSALLRSGPSQVTHLYARFGDSASNPGWLAPTDADMRKVSRSTFLQSSHAAVGGLWVPVLSAPNQETSDSSLYTGNKVTFFFRIPYNISNDQVDPDNFDVDTSYIYALGLGVATNASDRTQDQIVSTLQAVGWDDEDLAQGYFDKFQVAPGGQSTVDYSMEFVLPD